MSFIFGGARATGSNSVRDMQREVRCGTRGIERDIARLEMQERPIQKELARLGKEGKLSEATEKARELVRLRANKQRLHGMRQQMSGLSSQLSGVQGSVRMQEVLAGATRMLQTINSRVDASTVQRTLAVYEKESAIMTDKQDIIDETLESSLAVDNELQDSDNAVMDILKEAGLEAQLAALALKRSVAADEATQNQTLEERLTNLRSG